MVILVMATHHCKDMAHFNQSFWHIGYTVLAAGHSQDEMGSEFLQNVPPTTWGARE